MNFLQTEHHTDKSNITKTGYRALFLIMQLIQKPLSRDELVEILEADPIIKKDLSKDTITNTINTLRKAGCIISRPTQKTNNKYVLKSHPFNVLLSKEQIDALQTFRNCVVSNGDWRFLVYLNNLYLKISKFAPDEQSREILCTKHPFNEISLDIINNLLLFIKTKRKAVFVYKSPKHGLENLEFSPEYITFENEKLYVWGHNLKYDSFGYLRIDKIKEINTDLYKAPKASDDGFIKTSVDVEYVLKGYSAKTFIANEYEQIQETLSDGEYSLKILATVNNEFNFYQRILSFGADCKILTPDSVKNEFVEILKSIKAGYENVG